MQMVEDLFPGGGLVTEVVEKRRRQLYAQCPSIDDVGNVPAVRPCLGRQLAVDEGGAGLCHTQICSVISPGVTSDAAVCALK